MAHWRRAARRDIAERPIIDALIKAGASVTQLNIEDGPDLLVGYEGTNFLIEVKTRRAKLKKGQAAWHAEWKGMPVLVARTPGAALSGIDAPHALIDRILAEGGTNDVKAPPKPPKGGGKGKPPKK
jgi:hypothetical protein